MGQLDHHNWRLWGGRSWGNSGKPHVHPDSGTAWATHMTRLVRQFIPLKRKRRPAG